MNLNIDGDDLKHPIGFIAEYVMALHKAYPELQDDCLLLFESMINDQGEASGCGRSRILQNANYLFDKNEEWFKNNLLDEFNWANGDRAQQSWLALSWSQSDSSPKLIHLTLSYFSSSIAKASLLTGYFGTHFRSFLSWILLQFHDQFTGKQKDIITDSLNKSQEMIESIAKEAMKRIDELPNGGTPAECCKKTLLPFFKSEFFPKTDIAMSSEVTSCLLDICVLAGDAFPSAVNCLRYWMEATPPKRPLHYLMILPNNPCYQIWRQKFPNEMLQWLKCLGLETFNNPHELRMCCEKLQEILDVLPTTAVKDDPLFKRLEALCSRHQ